MSGEVVQQLKGKVKQGRATNKMESKLGNIISYEVTTNGRDEAEIWWQDDNGMFGQIEITLNANGLYTLDSEYLGIESVLKIFKAIK